MAQAVARAAITERQKLPIALLRGAQNKELGFILRKYARRCGESGKWKGKPRKKE